MPALSIMLRSYSPTDPGPGGWRGLFDRAQAAEDAGVDRLFVSDHVVFGEHMDAYARPEVGGQEGGRQPTGPDGHWLEPLTVLTALSSVTSRIRLATGILLAALRRPVVLAKTAATIDALSGGRLDLGVGVGWQREEYEAAGLDFERRGVLLDHTLDVCQTLWRESPAHFESDELTFGGIHQFPHPVDPGGVPIWVSGTVNKRVLVRIVRFGSGWIPWGPAEADPAAWIPRVHEALSDAGRDTNGFDVAGRLPVVTNGGGDIDVPRTMERVPPLVAAGVTDFRAFLRLPSGRSAASERLAVVVEAFREATS
ncbi:MAG: TIGR03619 family F420-dependent LLM class oxidoreductase [Acidimicrobiia bacterium]|nr:TIGR03619 family F420-dependent LLM class oxidoreductase [Acidimicrobiia bacterium]